MANSNVDIANKIFAYLKHGEDINDSIKEVYKSSLIFIGDEKQIYVPILNTYVGVGESRFKKLEGSAVWERGEGGFSVQTRETNSLAKGEYSVAEGEHSLAIGEAAHAEGKHTNAFGAISHAEGNATTAKGNSSHTEGVDTLTYGKASHAEGESVVAYGEASHAEGFADELYDGNITTSSALRTTWNSGRHYSIAYAKGSHIEGGNTLTLGTYSHAEGYKSYTQSAASYAHVEGWSSYAIGVASHAEGCNTAAIGSYSHAEGNSTRASGAYAHAQGQSTLASGNWSHAEGFKSQATNNYARAQGNNAKATNQSAFANGFNVTASGLNSHAEGEGTTASGRNSHAEGLNTTAGAYSHAEGNATNASGQESHAEGKSTTASGTNSHAEGVSTIASGVESHAEGQSTRATNNNTHAEGYGSLAEGLQSHAEGANTVAHGERSHAEGTQTRAWGNYSHSEGQRTLAAGAESHAEGSNSYAMGIASHTEGWWSYALGDDSHAEGIHSYTYNIAEHAQGAYNLSHENSDNFGDPYNSIFEVGIGTSDADRKNMVLGMQNGDLYVYNIGDYDGTNPEEAETVQSIFNRSNVWERSTGEYSGRVIGSESTAEGEHAIAEGFNTQAIGYASHAEGLYTSSDGDGSHAEGNGTLSNGDYSHAEGNETLSDGDYSHAEGNGTTANGSCSHSEGFSTRARGMASHSEGKETFTYADYSHAEGLYSATRGYASHAEGQYTYAYGVASHAEGKLSYAYGIESHAEGSTTISYGEASHAEGDNTTAYGAASHAEGSLSYAYGLCSHVEGYQTYTGNTVNIDDLESAYLDNHIPGSWAHAEGNTTVAQGSASHSEGCNTLAYGNMSHAEGEGTIAKEDSSHAEGLGTISYGVASHAEGSQTRAWGHYSHVEGSFTYAYGNSSHSEGRESLAYSDYSHAEGQYTYAIGKWSHAEGRNSYTYNSAEHAEGQFNASHKSGDNFGLVGNTIHSVGIGTSASNRKNALEIMQAGNTYLINLGNFTNSTLSYYNGTNPGSSLSVQNIINEHLKDGISIPQLTNQNVDRFAYAITGIVTSASNDLKHDISYVVTGVPTKLYVDELIAANDAIRYCGTVSVSSTANGSFTLTHNPAAGPAHGTTPDTTRGALYKVSNTGYFGEQRVKAGDIIISYDDTTTASSAEGWDVINENIDLRQLKVNSLNGKNVITNVELTADGTFSYTYNELAVTNNAPGKSTSGLVTQSSGNVNLNTTANNSAIPVVTGVSLNQNGTTTELSYNVTYIYSSLNHHGINNGINGGEIILTADAEPIISGITISADGTISYAYNMYKVSSSPTADTISYLYSKSLASYTHSVVNIYIDSANGNRLTYSYVDLTTNNGVAATAVTLTNSTKTKVLNGITQRGDGKISYSYTEINTTHSTATGYQSNVISLNASGSPIISGVSLSADGVLSYSYNIYSVESSPASDTISYLYAKQLTSYTHSVVNIYKDASNNNRITYSYVDLTTNTGVADSGVTLTNSATTKVLNGIKQRGDGKISYSYLTINTTHSSSGSSAANGETVITNVSLSADGVLSYTYNNLSVDTKNAVNNLALKTAGTGITNQNILRTETDNTGMAVITGVVLSQDKEKTTLSYSYTYIYANQSHHTSSAVNQNNGVKVITNVALTADGAFSYTYNDLTVDTTKNFANVGLISYGSAAPQNTLRPLAGTTGIPVLTGVSISQSNDKTTISYAYSYIFTDRSHHDTNESAFGSDINLNQNGTNVITGVYLDANGTLSYVMQKIKASSSPGADALNETHTFWGQEFNGTQDVSGDMINIGYAYTSGNVKVTKTAYNKEFNGFEVTTNANHSIKFGVGTDGVNRGMLDGDANQWIIYTNGTNTYLPTQNVRIGSTTAPVNALSVTGNIDATGYVYAGTDVTAHDKLYVGVGGRTKNTYLYSDAANNIYAYTNGKIPLVIEDNDIRRGASNTTANIGTSTYPWNNIYSKTGTFSAAQGTAPFTITSTTLNTNLNADYLDGKHLNEVFDSLSFTDNKLKATIGGVEKEVTIAYASSATKLVTSRNFRVSDNDASHQGAQVSFDGTADVELKLPSYIKASIDGSSTVSYQVQTTALTSGASYFTFVDSNNSTKATENLYTTGNIYGTAAGAFTATGQGTFKTIKISDTTAAKHIEFSRGSWNYLAAPTSGSIAFITNGKGASAANTDVVIQDKLLAPGTTEYSTLGSSSLRWGGLYSSTGNFTGQITSSVAQGTAPFSITSTTINQNLNADLLDGVHAYELFTDLTATIDGSELYISVTIGGKTRTTSVSIWGDLSGNEINNPTQTVSVTATATQVN